MRDKKRSVFIIEDGLYPCALQQHGLEKCAHRHINRLRGVVDRVIFVRRNTAMNGLRLGFCALISSEIASFISVVSSNSAQQSTIADVFRDCLAKCSTFFRILPNHLQWEPSNIRLTWPRSAYLTPGRSLGTAKKLRSPRFTTRTLYSPLCTPRTRQQGTLRSSPLPDCERAARTAFARLRGSHPIGRNMFPNSSYRVM